MTSPRPGGAGASKAAMLAAALCRLLTRLQRRHREEVALRHAGPSERRDLATIGFALPEDRHSSPRP